MQFTVTAILTTLITLTAAAPAPQLPTAQDPAYFGLLALHSGSGVHLSSFSAALGSIFAGLPSQNASCDVQDTNTATFYIKDGGLYLYAASATPQQAYVDRSGLGQGKFGYTTGAQGAPHNAERIGWAITNGDLTFDNSTLIACPNSIEGAWSIWVDAGIANPASNTNCTGITARAVETTTPVGCLYTSN
ncbi:cell wall protein PhiA [Coleophoma cylindrospora]|uniref:Cell wall protein PhiA n=1 Tax=Coleophoma cylindrospora TaxID=1849047 RepID=A0A3D8QA24_9HELO|nr:cell wall protein PhiA [Coleophoma cylindrospora]